MFYAVSCGVYGIRDWEILSLKESPEIQFFLNDLYTLPRVELNNKQNVDEMWECCKTFYIYSKPYEMMAADIQVVIP